MSVEVIAIGGYQEVGKNMTAVRIGEDVIIFDKNGKEIVKVRKELQTIENIYDLLNIKH